MAFHMIIEVREGNPIQTTRQLLRMPLENNKLDAFLLPVWNEAARRPTPTVVSSPERLSDADPFAPVMVCNSGGVAFDHLEKNPDQRIGIILRPCELRTLLFLLSERGIRPANLLLISMDCLATFPPEDFGWRYEKIADRDTLSKTALHFAAQGGLLPSRYRGSCQLCAKPYPERADLQFELFGIETSEQICLKSDHDDILDRLGMDVTSFKPVPPEMIERRERTLERLIGWRRQSRAYASAHLTPEQKTLSGLLHHLKNCPDCQRIMAEHCPTFELEWVTDASDPPTEVLENWMGYCGGCGMCEHSCPQDFPIFTIISFLSNAISTAQ